MLRFLNNRWLALLQILSLSISFLPQAAAFSAYTNDELEQLEREFVQQINQSNQVIRDPLAEQYINHLGQRLAQHTDVSPPHFFIVNADEINAFAGPGGYIGVNSRLILATETESELAAVMAHELSHVRQHHLYRMIEHQKQMRIPMLASVLAAIALGAINPALGSGALMGALTNFSQDNVNFVRSNEKEADSIGIDLLIKSGLDPRGMASFFKKMQTHARYHYTEDMPAILRTHPLDEDRIAEAENRSQHAVHPPYADPLDYHLFKALIQVTVSAHNPASLRAMRQQCQHLTHAEICPYTQALIALKSHQFYEATQWLQPLRAAHPNNLYFAIAMASAEAGNGHPERATALLAELNANFPDHYAIIRHYADMLISAHQSDRAIALLLKATRLFPNDRPLCEQLARTQAHAHQTGYAYFTLAQCHVLRGEMRDAVRTLMVAKSLAKQNHILTARINARIEELKAMQ